MEAALKDVNRLDCFLILSELQVIAYSVEWEDKCDDDKERM
jgi:hypothetical protein